MARPTELFAEEVHVMKALFQEYNKRNDVEAVSTVEQDIEDICRACASREADARHAIKELSREVRELEGQATYPHREGLHVERVAALQRQIDVAKQLVEELEGETRSVEKQRERIDTQLRAAMTAAQDAAAVSSSEGSLLRHQLSMYAHITRVTWRLDQPQAVAGTVSDSKTGDIRIFNFDSAKVNRFELVNALWELL